MSIIKYEVNWESDDTSTEAKKVSPENDFAMLLADEAPVDDVFSKGELVTGIVSSSGDGDILVDLGGKTSAILLRESIEGSVVIEKGQEISAYVIGFSEGSVLLSKSMTSKMKGLEGLESAYNAKMAVKGKVLKANKGGFEIQLQGKVAFCPISQIDSKFVSNSEEYIGREFEFLITQYNPKNLVVSRQALLKLKEKELIPQLVERMKTDPFISGTVTDLKDFGAIVDLGGPQGMIHISEVAFGRVNHPSEVLKIGENVRVKIIKIETGDKPKISLSLKQAGTDPWTEVGTLVKVDESYPGKVTRLTDFGAFVEIKPGLEGLIHISEMSWTKRISHPKEVLSVGQQIVVRVIGIDSLKQRISLTLKESHQDPWLDILTKLPVASVHKGKVQSLKSHGALIELEGGLTGFIPMSQLKAAFGESYRKHASPPKDLEIEIAFVDPSQKKLGLKIPGLAQGDESLSDFKEYLELEKTKIETPKELGSFGELLQRASNKKS